MLAVSLNRKAGPRESIVLVPSTEASSAQRLALHLRSTMPTWPSDSNSPKSPSHVARCVQSSSKLPPSVYTMSAAAIYPNAGPARLPPPCLWCRRSLISELEFRNAQLCGVNYSTLWKATTSAGARESARGYRGSLAQMQQLRARRFRGAMMQDASRKPRWIRPAGL